MSERVIYTLRKSFKDYFKKNLSFIRDFFRISSQKSFRKSSKNCSRNSKGIPSQIHSKVLQWFIRIFFLITSETSQGIPPEILHFFRKFCIDFSQKFFDHFSQLVQGFFEIICQFNAWKFSPRTSFKIPPEISCMYFFENSFTDSLPWFL